MSPHTALYRNYNTNENLINNQQVIGYKNDDEHGRQGDPKPYMTSKDILHSSIYNNYTFDNPNKTDSNLSNNKNKIKSTKSKDQSSK
jgi:hypothetical protein